MSSQIEIIRAVAHDAIEIADILVEAFTVFKEHYTTAAFDAVTPSAELIVERLDEGPIWVAVSGGDAILGTVSIVAEPEWLYIRSMAVRPIAQGLGVGAKLLDAVEVYGVENGFDRLFLYTTYFSAGAVEFYEKCGFKRGRDTTADEWFGTPGLAMDKRIGKDVKKNAVGS
ncbi:MAG: GNAT family N-acetyltransferase [Acidobacteriota bacterium]